MLARNPVFAALAALVLGLVACGDARPVQEGGGGGGACTTCHGTSGRVGNLPGTDPNLAAAPPIAPAGEPAQVIGAHQAHLNPAATGSLTGPIACNECHVVPTNSAHATTPPAQVVQFGTLATTGGAAPTWNSPDKVTNTTCSNVYCHGNFTFGGVTGTVANTPDWTGTNQAACGSCHGLPPTGHPTLAAGSTNQTCAVCHDQTVLASGSIDVPGGKHVNGLQEVVAGLPHQAGWLNQASPEFHAYAVNSGGPAACQTCHAFQPPAQVTTVVCSTCHNGSFAPSLSTCTGCHGGIDNNTGAPPRATWGNQADTVRVGAHTSHVEGTHTLSNPVACSECHVVPADAFSAGHIDQPTATLTWGTLATTGGANPQFTRTPPPTCSATYCHGSTLPAGTGTPNRTPVWTTVDGSQITCGTSCHGSPPPTGIPISADPAHVWHVTAAAGPHQACTVCHSNIPDAGGTAIVTPALHVNGTVNAYRANSTTPVVNGWTCNNCH